MSRHRHAVAGSSPSCSKIKYRARFHSCAGTFTRTGNPAQLFQILRWQVKCFHTISRILLTSQCKTFRSLSIVYLALRFYSYFCHFMLYSSNLVRLTCPRACAHGGSTNSGTALKIAKRVNARACERHRKLTIKKGGPPPYPPPSLRTN